MRAVNTATKGKASQYVVDYCYHAEPDYEDNRKLTLPKTLVMPGGHLSSQCFPNCPIVPTVVAAPVADSREILNGILWILRS